VQCSDSDIHAVIDPPSFPSSLPPFLPPSTFATSIKESETPHTTFITADVSAFSLPERGREGGREDWAAYTISEEEALRKVKREGAGRGGRV